MERHEALGFFEQGESYIKMYLKGIKGDCDPLVFNGTNGINNIFKVEKCIRKVIEYIRDKKEDSEMIKIEILNLRDLVTELYQEANKKGYIGFKGVCECIIDSINAMERFDPIPETGKNDSYPTIPKELKDLFPSEEQCETFVRMNYGKSHKVVANAYLEEQGVEYPDTPKYMRVKTILYNYFILPFKPKDGEEQNNIYCVPSTFYRHFKY